MKEKAGNIYVPEGLDGSGKTTARNLAVELKVAYLTTSGPSMCLGRYASNGWEAAECRRPIGKTLNQEADETLRTEHFARASHRTIGKFVPIDANGLGIQEVTSALLAEIRRTVSI